MNDLSLFGIESGLHELFSAWQEAETPEQVEAAEVAIRACAEAEVRKVDNIRRYWRALDALVAAAKHEAVTQAERAKLIDARRERLKSVVYDVMDNFGLKKLEGQTGTLYLKGNGGKQAVEIADPAMIPEEFCMISCRFNPGLYPALATYLNNLAMQDEHIKLEIAPSNPLIAEALARNCPKCDGSGVNKTETIWRMDETITPASETEAAEVGKILGFGDTCATCGGTGKQGVPGARLAPRGQHVECR